MRESRSPRASPRRIPRAVNDSSIRDADRPHLPPAKTVPRGPIQTIRKRGSAMFPKRGVVSRMLPIVPLLLLSVDPAPAAAQDGEVVCGTCNEAFWGGLHRFPEGGDGCRSSGDFCSRCGGTSKCHRWWYVEWDLSGCHIACGPAGDMALAEAVHQVRGALAAGNTNAVAASVMSHRADLLVEYRPDTGRIDFILSCDPSAAAATVAVLPALRPALELGIRELAVTP